MYLYFGNSSAPEQHSLMTFQARAKRSSRDGACGDEIAAAWSEDEISPRKLNRHRTVGNDRDKEIGQMNSINLEAGHLDVRAPTNDDEMHKHGITRVHVEYFHYRNFRYSALKDALAQARRDELES